MSEASTYWIDQSRSMVVSGASLAGNFTCWMSVCTQPRTPPGRPCPR